MVDIDGNKVKDPDAFSPDDIRSMCVTPDTEVKVKLCGGKKYKLLPISEVLDNFILSDIEIKTSKGYRKLHQKFIYSVDEELIKITLDSGETLTTTEDHTHLIYSKDCELINIGGKDLLVGMEVSCDKLERSESFKKKLSEIKKEGYESGKYKKKIGEENFYSTNT